MVNKLTILTTIHVLAATLWVGGNFTLNLATTLAFRSGDKHFQISMFKVSEFIGQKVFTVLALVLLVAGIWLGADYYEMNVFWINYGIVGLIATAAIGMFFLGPRVGRLADRLAEGATQEEIAPQARVLKIVSRIDFLILASVVCVMVIKPGS